MKSKVFVAIAALTLLLTSVRAIACVTAPWLCYAVGTGMVTGIYKIHDALTDAKELQPFLISQDTTVVEAISRDYAENSNWPSQKYNDLGILIGRHAWGNSAPSYSDIAKAYESNDISKLNSLPKQYGGRYLYSHLDEVADLIATHTSPETVEDFYGPKVDENGQVNWRRYYLLTADSAAILVNESVVNRMNREAKRLAKRQKKQEARLASSQAPE